MAGGCRGFNLIARRLSHCRPSWERSELWVQLESRALPIQFWAHSSRRSLAVCEAGRRLSDPSMPVRSFKAVQIKPQARADKSKRGRERVVAGREGKMKCEPIRKSSFESCTMSLRAYQAGEKTCRQQLLLPLRRSFLRVVFLSTRLEINHRRS